MKVEIISIGDELLLGQTVNTNATWMGMAMREIGADIEYGTVIRDEMNAMLDAIDRAMNRVDVVLITGGLGPTKDDITKKVLCTYFNTPLVEDAVVLNHVRAFFESRGRKMLDVNVQQAHVPEKSAVLHNELGTAPGMWFEEKGKVLVSMPGVPYEMKHIMTDRIIPRLKERYALEGLYYKTVQVQGLGETYIAERIKEIEDEIRSEGFALAYLPSPGLVRLRVSHRDRPEHREKIQDFVDRITKELQRYAFGFEEDTLEQVVGDLLKKQEATVTTVESCTGGAVAAHLTSVPGASDYFNGALVTYSNRIKRELVNVSPEVLNDYGAVSKETVEQMAVGGREKMKATYAIALSGIAGPDGGSEEKPVGTVWIAVAGPNRVYSKKFLFENNRERNIRRSVLSALNMLRCEILGLNLEKSL
jgi:nicotinamide-nucleotide amidase